MISWLHCDCSITNIDYMLPWCRENFMWHYFTGLSKIETADYVQQRSCSIVTRPLSLWESWVCASDQWNWQNFTAGERCSISVLKMSLFVNSLSHTITSLFFILVTSNQHLRHKQSNEKLGGAWERGALRLFHCNQPFMEYFTNACSHRDKVATFITAKANEW